MIKSELIQKIASTNQHIYQRDVERIVNVIFDEIVDALARGDRVELRGFGAFTVKYRGPRKGRNPRTGEAVFVEEKFVPAFKTGKELRERLNKNFEPSDQHFRESSGTGKGAAAKTTAKSSSPRGGVKTAASARSKTASKSTARSTTKSAAKSSGKAPAKAGAGAGAKGRPKSKKS